MRTWEEELEVLDFSDVWLGRSNPVQEVIEQNAEEDGGDDLAFPAEAAVPGASQGAVPGQAVGGVPQVQKQVEKLDVANAETQSSGLVATLVLSRCSSPLPSRPLNLTPRDDTLITQMPSSQIVVSRNPVSRNRGTQHPTDIRKFFKHGGPFSGSSVEEGEPPKKRRIPGPVGEILQKHKRADGNAVLSDGHAFDSSKDDSGDEIFRKGSWISALQSLNVGDFDPARYTILRITASVIGAPHAQQQAPHFVAVIKELNHNAFGDAAVVLKDPTGTVAGVINSKVFSTKDFGKAISPGAVIILKEVAIFSPSAHYLNITVNNIVQVFAVDTCLPKGSKKSEQQQQQEQLPTQPPDDMATAAKLAGWDLTADIEAILNDDGSNFYD